MKKIIIGIDGNEANVENKVGVSRYTYELLSEFRAVSCAQTAFRIFLRTPPLPDMPKESAHFKYAVISGRRLWSQFFLPLHLAVFHRDLSVFFAPAHYAPRWCPCPTVVTLHDLAYFYFPTDFLKKDLYQLKNWTQYSVSNAAKVIAVSRLTKEDAVKLYRVSADKVDVVYNGFSSQHTTAAPPAEKEKYFLYVGTLQPRKNIPTMIEGFELFVRTHPHYKLYIVGRSGWMYESVFEEVSRLKLEKNVIFTGYVSEERKKQLLAEAVALVMPGLYEGFGLPVLEAFNAGVPVIASSEGALSEVGGEGCLYVDPLNKIDFAQAFADIVQKRALRDKLVQYGKKRVKQFSWNKCAKETLQVLTQAAYEKK